MKRLLLASVILISSAAAQTQKKVPPPVPAAHDGCTIEGADQAAKEIAQAWKNGYNRGDAASVAALYSEDAYYLTQHFVTGIVRGRGRIRAYVQRGVDAGYHIDAIQILSTDCSGELAYTIGRYESTNASHKAFGVNLVVLKKIGKDWRIVAHEAAVPDPATAIQNLEAPPAQHSN